MKNTMADLNNHLFAQMERLGDESLTQEQLEREAARAKSMVQVADTIINNAETCINAAKLASEHGIAPNLPLLGVTQ